MPKYIDADKLLLDRGNNNSQKIMWHNIKVLIARTPRADVALIKRGEWKFSYKSGFIPAQGSGCSECDCWAERRSTYCPNCAAIMEVQNDNSARS